MTSVFPRCCLLPEPNGRGIVLCSAANAIYLTLHPASGELPLPSASIYRRARTSRSVIPHARCLTVRRLQEAGMRIRRSISLVAPVVLALAVAACGGGDGDGGGGTAA